MDIKEITTTVIEVEKEKIYKKSTPNFFLHLLDCLNKGKHIHMLKYVPNSNNKEFQVIFINKHYSGWTEKDISLFEDSDKYIEQIHGRSLVSLDCKGRFRARLRKCIGKYVKRINKEKDEEFKCKTVGKYRILKIPQNSYVEEVNRNKRRNRRKSSGKEKEKSEKKEVNEKSSHELAHLANMPIEGNYIMHSENVCQENNTKIIPQVSEEKDRNDSRILCLISVSQSEKKEVNEQSSHKLAHLANMPIEGNYIMHSENVCQENNTKIIPQVPEEKDRNDSHILCLISVSQNNAIGLAPSMRLNILKMWKAPNTFFGNLDANANNNVIGLAPSMSLNILKMWKTPNSFFGNLDANTNIWNGMETETVIGNLDASINVPNVGMETVIGNSDADTNLVTFDGYIPSMDLNRNVAMKENQAVIGNSDPSINVPNVEMKTVIGNSNANINVPNVEMETVIRNSNANINVPNVGKETVIGNLNASINVPNVGMETVIGNSNASINVPNVGMETVIGNSNASINVPNVRMETVIGNSDANTNLYTLGAHAPSMDLNVQNLGMEAETVFGNLDARISAPNVRMETVIGNSDDYTNLDTLGAYAPSMDLNVQNLGMEAETVFGNLDARISAPNVRMETVIGNSDDYTNLDTLGAYAPSMDLNVQNLGMEAETVFGNLDARISVPNVRMETEIGNSDDYTNLDTLGAYAPSMDLNVQNVGMEVDTVIGNLDASINIPNVGMETVIGNSDASINVPNVGIETITEILDYYTNMEKVSGCSSSVGSNVQNSGMETAIGNSDAEAIDSIGKIDEWFINFQPIC